MASSSRKMKRDERPHFFKIIFDDSKLAIPRKFVQLYGDNLSSPVMLKVPISGVKWRVEIVKSEGEIWLQNGWREFAEHYSVVEGSFLVFEYEKKSNCEFNVIIFDKTATEIGYPITSFTNGDHDRVANFNREQVPQEPNNKKIKLGARAKTLDHYCLTDVSINCLITSGNNKKSIEKESRCKERKVSFSNRGEAKEAAKKSTSVNPSFQALISSVCLRRGVVYVPSSFIKNMKQETEYIRLKVNNRCWHVKLIISPECCKGLLSAGWSAFARDNFLKEGDVCTFHLISNTDQTPLINVSINKEKFIKKTRKEAKKKPMKIDRACSTFQIVIKRSHSHGSWSRLDMPAAFARKYMTRNDGHAVLNVLDGKTWSVEYCRKLICGVIRTRLLHSDWTKFVQGNNLQVGDTCTFKLIDPDKIIFGVTISKATNLDSGKSKQSNPPKAARKSTSVNPSFQAVMTSRHLNAGGGVNVPHHFIENLEQVTRIAQLQVGNRIWCRKLIFFPYCDKSLFSGWVSFARENSLKVGDVCSFELIDTQNLLIKVSINGQ